MMRNSLILSYSLAEVMHRPHLQQVIYGLYVWNSIVIKQSRARLIT